MHEVNNRLAALTNLIFLVRTLSECSLQSVEYLDEADSQLRSLGEITSRSLAFIRLDTEAKEIDLVELATSALHLHHEQISKKRINVQTRSSESALARVKKGEIFQVVTNLLLNSIEALPHSGNLHVRVAIRRSNAIITIADNGAGIPESMRGTLFDAFKSNRSEGNGLGLWIVREIVHGHGGTIQYRSSSVVGRSGTIFRACCPLNPWPAHPRQRSHTLWISAKRREPSYRDLQRFACFRSRSDLRGLQQTALRRTNRCLRPRCCEG
jgi:signal transduction histidine kinase